MKIKPNKTDTFLHDTLNRKIIPVDVEINPLRKDSILENAIKGLSQEITNIIPEKGKEKQ